MSAMRCGLRVIVCFIAVSMCNGYRYKPKQLRCERITIPMCADMRYNLTQMPNLLGHTSQKEAAEQVHEFIPLVQIGCSPLLKFFLCSEYAPMCTEQVDETIIIPPCRSLCLKVKASCEPILLKFHFYWPAALDCGLLPEKSDRIDLCIEPPKDGELDAEDDTLQSINVMNGNNDLKTRWILELEGLRESYASSTASTKEHQLIKQSDFAALCPNRYIFVDKTSRSQQQQSQYIPGSPTCAPMCDVDILFGRQDKRLMETWMTIWSTLALASSLLTLLTFLIDMSRFKYPERPIIFISLCCTVYSSAYVVRILAGGRAVSCESSPQFPDVAYRIEDGLESVWCTVIFILLYYFGMAQCAWWVVLTITWYLASWRKWGGEAIAALGNVFHLAAWSLPAIKTIVILALRRVDGEELTGLCYVGSRDKKSLAAFLLVPLVLYLSVGMGFTAAGFVAVCRIRSDLKKDGTNIGKLERLMAKMGIFSVLYAVPGLCVFGCLVYEYGHLAEWQRHSLTRPCDASDSSSIATLHHHESADYCPLSASIPPTEVYLAKVFMSLVTGITSGMWIWSCKTVASWKALLRSVFRCGRQRSSSKRRRRRVVSRENKDVEEKRGGEGHVTGVVYPGDQYPPTSVFSMSQFSNCNHEVSDATKIQTGV